MVFPIHVSRSRVTSQMLHTQSPEELELRKKQKVLDRLKDRLADEEEDMTDLKSNLEQFEANYTSEVARFYADWDEIEAQIAEEEAKLVPDDEEIKKRAEELRRKAEESAADVEEHSHCGAKWTPTPEAKKAYHNLAKIIHPDLALDEQEKERRHELMAKLNFAYSSGNQNLLNKLVEDFRDAPELVKGDSIADNLVRVIRQIHQVKLRLKELKAEFERLELSEHYVLWIKVEAEMKEGRDLLKQMGNRAKSHIAKSTRRLNTLKNLNVAQEDYVKEKYGMDIGEFRK